MKNSKFIFLWTSQILSQITIYIMNFLLLTKLFTATGSSIATSFLWIAYSVPAVFVGPIGAAFVDLYSKRKILMITNLLQALVVFSYLFFHQTRIFLIYGVVLGYSFLNQFYLPAESSSLPQIVRKPSLPQANSLFFITQQVALIIGFGIAGVLERLLGFNGVLITCSLLLFIAFISVSFLPEMKSRKKMPQSLENAIVKFFSTIAEGYRFIKENKEVLIPFLTLLGLQISLAVIIVSVPTIASQIFMIPLGLAGILIIVPAGIGAFLGSVLSPRLLARGWRKKKIIELSFSLVALSLFIMIFVLPFLGETIRIILGAMTIVLTSFSFVGILIPSLTYLQEVTPVGLRGRVLGNFGFLVTIASILPVLFSGAIIEVFGVRLLLLILGACSVLVLIYSKKSGQKFIENRFNNSQ